MGFGNDIAAILDGKFLLKLAAAFIIVGAPIGGLIVWALIRFT